MMPAFLSGMYNTDFGTQDATAAHGIKNKLFYFPKTTLFSLLMEPLGAHSISRERSDCCGELNDSSIGVMTRDQKFVCLVHVSRMGRWGGLPGLRERTRAKRVAVLAVCSLESSGDKC